MQIITDFCDCQKFDFISFYENVKKETVVQKKQIPKNFSFKQKFYIAPQLLLSPLFPTSSPRLILASRNGAHPWSRRCLIGIG